MRFNKHRVSIYWSDNSDLTAGSVDVVKDFILFLSFLIMIHNATLIYDDNYYSGEIEMYVVWSKS